MHLTGGLSMTTIFVHPTDRAADAASLSLGLSRSRPGDVVVLGAGSYGPSTSGERLPLRIPVGVAVEGSGAEDCILDGEGQFEPSFDPIRAARSVVLLEDGASLAGVTVTNGGGHGIGVPLGASVTIRNCHLSRHGDHGVFVGGAAQAVITNCVFEHNGLKRFAPELPRGAGARQGHHIFAEARHGQANQLLISDNTMRDCFADGIAFVCFFPEPNEVSFGARILRNTIEASERGGLLFSCSFGPSQNRYQILAVDNVLKDNQQFGLNIMTAVPLADRVPQHNHLHGLIAGNTISGSPLGLAVHGALGEAHHNRCEVTLDRNRITGCPTNAIRLVGASGAPGVASRSNTLEATVCRNSLSGRVVIQAAGGPEDAELEENNVSVRLRGNTGTPEQALRVSDGPSGNAVTVQDDSQAYLRTRDNLI